MDRKAHANKGSGVLFTSIFYRIMTTNGASAFREQISLAGAVVVGTTYLVTGSIWDAVIVGAAHGAAHYISGLGTTYSSSSRKTAIRSFAK